MTEPWKAMEEYSRRKEESGYWVRLEAEEQALRMYADLDQVLPPMLEHLRQIWRDVPRPPDDALITWAEYDNDDLDDALDRLVFGHEVLALKASTRDEVLAIRYKMPAILKEWADSVFSRDPRWDVPAGFYVSRILSHILLAAEAEVTAGFLREVLLLRVRAERSLRVPESRCSHHLWPLLVDFGAVISIVPVLEEFERGHPGGEVAWLQLTSILMYAPDDNPVFKPEHVGFLGGGVPYLTYMGLRDVPGVHWRLDNLAMLTAILDPGRMQRRLESLAANANIRDARALAAKMLNDWSHADRLQPAADRLVRRLGTPYEPELEVHRKGKTPPDNETETNWEKAAEARVDLGKAFCERGLFGIARLLFQRVLNDHRMQSTPAADEIRNGKWLEKC
jgi:hypothetical protein